MKRIIQFKPRREVDALQNVNYFIIFAKNLDIFGKNLEWESNKWEVQKHVEYRSIKNATNLLWHNFDTKRGRNNTLLQKPFIDFAKSYITFTQSIKTTKTYTDDLYALRALEKALRELKYNICITHVDINVLNRAQKLLKDKYKPNTAAIYSKKLEIISKFIVENHMLNAPRFVWRTSTIQKDGSRKAGKDFENYRKDKLPTDACMYAIADIFNKTQDYREIIATGIAAILFSNPSRLGEVLTLTEDCMVDHHQGIDGALGIRWFPEKNGVPFVKPILPVWVSLFHKVFEKVQSVTEEARKMAKWYENNPKLMFLPEKYQWIREADYIDTKILRDLLSISKATLSRNIINGFGIKQYFMGNRDGSKTGTRTYSRVNVRDINNFVCSLLPGNFPYRYKMNKLKYSDCLFIVPRNFFLRADARAYSQVMFQPISYQNLSSLFGGVKGNKSIFDSHGYKEANGERMVFKTHSARHWQESISQYNTIAQNFRSYMAGRLLTKHNASYNHASLIELTDKCNEIYDHEEIRLKSVDSSIKIYKHPDLEEISSAVGSLFGHFNFTEMGFCLLSPGSTCERGGDHVLCSENLYCKGDQRLNNIPERIIFLKAQINFIETKYNEFSIRIPNLIHHKQELQVLSAIQNVNTNSLIQIGSFFKLTPNTDYSSISVTYYNKNHKLLHSTDAHLIPIIKAGELCLDT